MEEAVIKYEARAIQRYLRRAPRKLRLLADLVRGMRVDIAIETLKHVNKGGALEVSKVVRSASANLQNKFEDEAIEHSSLVIKTIMIDEGPTLKRIQPAPQGRAHPIRKRMSHITVVVERKEELETSEE